MEEARVELIHWRDVNGPVRRFVIMWTDGTWEEFQISIEDYWDKNGKTFRQRLDLQKIMKKPRSFAIDYIERKRKELS